MLRLVLQPEIASRRNSGTSLQPSRTQPRPAVRHPTHIPQPAAHSRSIGIWLPAPDMQQGRRSVPELLIHLVAGAGLEPAQAGPTVITDRSLKHTRPRPNGPGLTCMHTGGRCWGSNQRRLSRRFYSPSLLTEAPAVDQRGRFWRHASGSWPSAIRPCVPGFGGRGTHGRGRWERLCQPSRPASCL